jgi:hypothetical protein
MRNWPISIAIEVGQPGFRRRLNEPRLAERLPGVLRRASSNCTVDIILARYHAA